jgi:hypothetical protein
VFFGVEFYDKALVGLEFEVTHLLLFGQVALGVQVAEDGGKDLNTRLLKIVYEDLCLVKS